VPPNCSIAEAKVVCKGFGHSDLWLIDPPQSKAPFSGRINSYVWWNCTCSRQPSTAFLGQTGLGNVDRGGFVCPVVKVRLTD
jgi:hypothetical protein